MTDKVTKAYNTIYNFCLYDDVSEQIHVLEQSLKIIKEELDRHGLQDISTAPKDGTEFLAYNGEYFICCWRNNPYGNGMSGWSWVIPDICLEWARPEPTQWMPLPTPNKEQP